MMMIMTKMKIMVVHPGVQQGPRRGAGNIYFNSTCDIVKLC